MRPNDLVLVFAAALSALATCASAVDLFGNSNQKGSLLIFPRVDVTPVGKGRGFVHNETVITLVNDGTTSVRLRCFYSTSDPVPTPNTSPASSPPIRSLKHFQDFTIDLTHNQPASWYVSTGQAVDPSVRWGVTVAPAFAPFPDGTVRYAGELKCWAVNPAGSAEIYFNHLSGTATLYHAGAPQASEYTAWAFQAIGPASLTGTELPTPGVLALNGEKYDFCPSMLLGSFHPPTGAYATRVTLAACNEDLRENFTPTVTRLTWTFWNQDAAVRTGTRFCADSWFDTDFPARSWPLAQFNSLGTGVAYFRTQTSGDTKLCGEGAETSAYVGVKEEFGPGGDARGTNLTGSGLASGVIRYEVFPPF